MIPFRGPQQAPPGREALVIPEGPKRDPLRAFIEDSPLSAQACIGYESGALLVRLDSKLSDLSDEDRELWVLLSLLVKGTLLNRPEVTSPLSALAARVYGEHLCTDECAS